MKPATGEGRRRRWGARRFDARTPRADRAVADLLMALRRPPEMVLTATLRRLSRRRPDLFERLGAAREACIVIAPAELPICFRLSPSGADGQVRVARASDQEAAAARISGPLLTLLALFDGGDDADSAFFSRRIRIDGDTEAVVALHNTLEAAELTLADLLGLPSPMHARANAALASGLSRLRRMTGAA